MELIILLRAKIVKYYSLFQSYFFENYGFTDINYYSVFITLVQGMGHSEPEAFKMIL